MFYFYQATVKEQQKIRQEYISKENSEREKSSNSIKVGLSRLRKILPN